MMCGAPGAVQPATAEVQEIVDQVKLQLEEKENKKYPVFKAVSYMCQVVAGTNYFVKVDTGENSFTHLRVFRSLPHENKPVLLSAYQTNKSLEDKLAYF
ncbi:cystatin-B [Ctenodactylus gundi]